VPEPRTHYQVSFTSRQAVLLFVLVLVSLAGAYFLGLVTGLAGHQPAESAAAAAPVPAPTPETGRVSAGVPAPSPAAAAATPEAQPSAAAAGAREPGAEGALQFFEDHPEEPGKAAPAPARKAGVGTAPAGGFWVQTLSTTSQNEAKSRRGALAAHGFHATVAPARGAKGPILYRVRVGPYASHEEASRAADVLVRKEKVKTWIVPPGE
jgi:cell division protein FtsN